MEVCTPAGTDTSNTLIKPDDESAREVTRANRSFCVSHTGNNRPARSSYGHDESTFILCSSLHLRLSLAVTRTRVNVIPLSRSHTLTLARRESGLMQYIE